MYNNDCAFAVLDLNIPLLDHLQCRLRGSTGREPGEKQSKDVIKFAIQNRIRDLAVTVEVTQTAGLPGCILSDFFPFGLLHMRYLYLILLEKTTYRPLG